MMPRDRDDRIHIAECQHHSAATASAAGAEDFCNPAGFFYIADEIRRFFGDSDFAFEPAWRRALLESDAVAGFG